MNRIYLERVH